ncbi:serine hydrolase [Hymenobacter sp. BT730]|uniref:serine hydrolase domain-containing protein n=1 Tax=Hymenobacter sp. BT730 TaxID=3063332 RepID=UPI0026DF1750|nr:serine hydrolase domain-containing protein [Hymenobacter sp. BT730]
MKQIFTFLLVLVSLHTSAQTGIPVPQLAHCDTAIQQFMKRWDVLGASVAISKEGKLVYDRAFGYADQARQIPMQPYNLLRVASVSKPVTAIAIMKLVEDGQISLSHKVFGPNGYLQSPYYLRLITDKRIYDITVQNLLEHTAGWDRSVPCDGHSGCDPIDFPLAVSKAMHAPNPVGDSTLIGYLLKRGLNTAPGKHYAYSNVGYLVLGKILEQVTHQPYEAWVAEHILRPAGVLEAHLGHNLPDARQERETEYKGRNRKASCYGTGQKVPLSYGGFNLEAMNAHGGWIFSARDLVRLLLSADGLNSRADLLSASTIETMTTPSAANPAYAKGWALADGNWKHSGYIDGTASYLARTPDGYTWAILLNSNGTSAQFWKALDKLGRTCVQGTDSWPSHDLLPPELNASELTATTSKTEAARLRWTNGNGTRRLVLVKADTPVDAFPQDGVAYTAHSSFGQGQRLGLDTFVVSNEEDNDVLVRNLNPHRQYYARVVEYRQDETTNNQPVYTLEGNPTLVLNSKEPVFAVVRASVNSLFARYFRSSSNTIVALHVPVTTRVESVESELTPRTVYSAWPIKQAGLPQQLPSQHTESRVN